MRSNGNRHEIRVQAGKEFTHSAILTSWPGQKRDSIRATDSRILSRKVLAPQKPTSTALRPVTKVDESRCFETRARLGKHQQIVSQTGIFSPDSSNHLMLSSAPGKEAKPTDLASSSQGPQCRVSDVALQALALKNDPVGQDSSKSRTKSRRTDSEARTFHFQITRRTSSKSAYEKTEGLVDARG